MSIPDEDALLAYRESARKNGFYASEFAEALRTLLRVPMGDPLHTAAVMRCKAILETYDEELQPKCDVRRAA